MTRVEIDRNAFVYPMPMTLVGSVVDGVDNFMAVGWVSRVNFRPPMIAVALGDHHTNKGLHDNGEFSVNVPGKDLLEATDYCGLVSGERVDKSDLFPVFRGELPNAPMIETCPVTMECRVVEYLELPTNEVFVGQIHKAYCLEDHLTDGRPDIEKIEPFTLTMPDNNFWLVGENAGRAWGSGKGYR
jgi:flavin reductase (DIM6/NTAB) family NADH-FMN oxidoreductase RutF